MAAEVDQLGPRNKLLAPLASKRQASQTIPMRFPMMMMITITIMEMQAMVTQMQVTQMPVTEMQEVMEMAAMVGEVTVAAGVVTEVVTAVVEENEYFYYNHRGVFQRFCSSSHYCAIPTTSIAR